MALLTPQELVKYNAGLAKHLPFVLGDLIPAGVLQLSSIANNGLSIDTTGLFAAKPVSMTFSGATNILTIVNSDGTTATVALNALAADKFLSSTSYNPATREITLVMSDASTFVIPLSDLIPVATVASSSVNVTGNGQTGSPITAAVIISSNAGNAISTLANGLFAVTAPVPTLAATPPGSTSDGTISTVIVGSNTSILGTPIAWESKVIGGVTYKQPLYSSV